MPISVWTAVLMAGLFVNPTSRAQTSDWQVGWNATLYGYGTTLDLNRTSVLNPDNRLADLSERDGVAEVRLDLKAESGRVRLTLRPILGVRADSSGDRAAGEAWLGQGQVRWRLDEAWNLAAGREVLNWGPAQFRSPSSPFYFDNGRGNPLAELSGVDALKLAWTPDTERGLALAYLAGDGHDAHGLRGSWLLHGEQRGGDWAAGLALAKTPGQGLFAGLHARHTYSDALLLYGEFASSTRADALVSPADAGQPFRLAPRSPRHGTFLAGATYTFENGRTLNLEYLHDGHGYRAGEEAAYFSRAAAAPALAGLALGHAPPLLGRDYLHLVWQSNLMDMDGYWRLMFTRNLTDGSHELAGYAERSLDDRASVFILARLADGGDHDGARGEFAAIVASSLTLGVKLALP